MKKHIFFITLCFGVTISSFAQWTTNGNNVTIDKNIGIGTTTPSAKLDIVGDIKVNVLYLNNTKPAGELMESRISYPGHGLVIGSSEGAFAHNSFALKPGGASQGPVFSYFSMFTASKIGVQDRKVFIASLGSSFLNGGNVGIGTESPTAKLDVVGDIKLNVLHLNNTKPAGEIMESRISYPGQGLIVGSPEGAFAHNSFVLKPGGASQGPVFSYFSMYTASKIGVQDRKVFIASIGNSFLNGGNVGIGTESPTAKLDVIGDVKLNVLHLNNTKPAGEIMESRISYPGHGLIIGSPEGAFAHNSFALKPGGASQGPVFSYFSMYTASKIGVQDRKVLISTLGNSFFAGGNVGIGTIDPQKLLDVKGTIHAQNIEVDLNGWADFVFDKDYKLPTLQEVEAHINEYNRLPDIPSEKQVREEGINIGEMQAKLLQKIEELTLYVIELKKENNEIKLQLNDLQK